MALQALSLAASVVIILAGAYKKIPDAYTLIASAFILGLSSGIPATEIPAAAARAALSLESLEFAGSVALIRVTGGILQEYGLLDRMSAALGRLLRNCKLAIMAVPALLGSLSVFGGAIMSAPVVDRLGNQLDLSPQRKAAVNIMFRHSVFFAFPLSTMLIFTANVAEVPVMAMVSVLWPLTVVMTLASYMVLLKRAAGVPLPADGPDAGSLKEFVVTSSPIWVAIALASFFGLRLVAALAAGVGVALLLVARHPAFTPRVILRFVDYQSIGAVLGVMIFKDFVTKMGFLETLMGRLTGAGIPLEVVAAIGMAIFCFSCGTVQAGGAVILPLMLAGDPAYRVRLLRACLIYIVGFMSYIISPVHMCQVLTNRFFGTDLASLYREYWPVILVTLGSGVLLYLAHTMVG